MNNNETGPKRLTLPISETETREIRAGQRFLLTGEILLARDAAHKRLFDLINSGEKLPVEINNAVIYYCGPTQPPPGHIIGSAGPTTSSRMDAFTPLLLSRGVRAMIGKGARSAEVIDAMSKYGAVYFAALGGAGALLAKCFESVEIAAFPDLGTEAIRRAFVRDFPVTAAADTFHNSLY